MKMRLLLLLLTTLPVASAVAQTSSEVAWPRLQPQVFVELAYPTEALDARLVGRVVVQVTTDATGRVVTSKSLAGPPLLAAAAVENAKGWTLTPGVRSGALVYRFEIDPGRCNDDRRSLFRLTQSNTAMITACTATHRTTHPNGEAWDVQFVSFGERPLYPPLAQSARFTGVILLEVSIDPSGKVVESQSLTNVPFLADAAVAHSRTWRARPAPTARRAVVVYEFALDNNVCDVQTRTAFWEVAPNVLRLSGCSPLVNF